MRQLVFGHLIGLNETLGRCLLVRSASLIYGHRSRHHTPFSATVAGSCIAACLPGMSESPRACTMSFRCAAAVGVIWFGAPVDPDEIVLRRTKSRHCGLHSTPARARTIHFHSSTQRAICSMTDGAATSETKLSCNIFRTSFSDFGGSCARNIVHSRRSKCLCVGRKARR